jgi:hypothetical protein
MADPGKAESDSMPDDGSGIASLFRQAEQLRVKGRSREAGRLYAEIINRRPDIAVAHMRLGVLLVNSRRYEKAIQRLRHALAIRPDVDTYYNLGVALQHLRKAHEAENCYRSALAIDPYHAPSLNNLGILCERAGGFEEAERCFREALRNDPHHSGRRHNLGQLQLRQGNWSEGWRNFEYRLFGRGMQAKWRGLPDRSLLWQGETIGGGGKLLVWCELGLGDTLQFVRYTRPLVEQGIDVTLAVQEPLVELIATGLSWKVKVIDRKSVTPQGWSRHVSLMSLPGILDPRLDRSASREPYLRAPSSHQRAYWGLPPDRKLVGIVWASGTSHPQLYHHKSIAVQRLVNALLEVPDITLVGLQFGDDAPQLAPLLQPRVVIPKFKTRSFDETAEVLEQLDAIVTPDTAMAHLAGALGRPVWTLLMYVPDWRWGLEDTDTCWYPTMRLARQRAFGDWQGALDFLVSDLSRALGVPPR